MIYIAIDNNKIMTKKIKNIKENIAKLPSKDGNYNLFNRAGEVVYTGQGSIKNRISDHKRAIDKHFAHFTYNLEPSAKRRNEIEEIRLKRYKPPLNKQKK